MSDYNRLTKRIEGAVVIKNAHGHDISFFGETINKVLDRLAELEDKIEQGTLIEFPRIVKTKKLDAKYCVEFINDFYGGIVDCYTYNTREEAEKRLKELQNV